jgi:hypothetical protein
MEIGRKITEIPSKEGWKTWENRMKSKFCNGFFILTNWNNKPLKHLTNYTNDTYFSCHQPNHFLAKMRVFSSRFRENFIENVWWFGLPSIFFCNQNEHQSLPSIQKIQNYYQKIMSMKMWVCEKIAKNNFLGVAGILEKNCDFLCFLGTFC